MSSSNSNLATSDEPRSAIRAVSRAGETRVPLALAGFFSLLRNTALWALWFALLAIWTATLWDHAAAGDITAVALAIASVVLWFILFFAEGIELAATDLLDKQPEQLHDPANREVLSEIQSRARFFIAQRQVFVVAIISFTSLAITYDSITVPFVGTLTDETLGFMFTFLFNTLTVLWFCQVTPKQLAVFNSELFLGQSRSVWHLIKLVGHFGLPNPSDALLSVIQRHSAYGKRRQLLPSRAAYYNVSTHRYGISLDKLLTEIVLCADGRTRIRKRFLLLFLHGRHGIISGLLEASSPFVSQPSVKFLALHLVSIPERFEHIENELDALFDQRPFASSGFSGNLIQNWLANIEVNVSPSFGRRGEVAEWTIEGERLPESFWVGSLQSSEEDRRLVALLYEVEAEVAAGAFDDTKSWSETFPLPCRTYQFSIRNEGLQDNVDLERCEVTLSNSDEVLYDETETYSYAALLAKDDVLIVDCPLQGATYAVSWRQYRAAST